MLVQLSMAVASRECDREGELEMSGCSPVSAFYRLLGGGAATGPSLSAQQPDTGAVSECRGALVLPDAAVDSWLWLRDAGGAGQGGEVRLQKRAKQQGRLGRGGVMLGDGFVRRQLPV